MGVEGVLEDRGGEGCPLGRQCLGVGVFGWGFFGVGLSEFLHYLRGGWVDRGGMSPHCFWPCS